MNSLRSLVARSSLRSCLSTYRNSSSYSQGDIIHNYRVVNVCQVPELFLTAIELKHLKTNSTHIHIARDDSNNVFNVLLPTIPMDSTGVAHILEHVVLCGSEKFPVRDPFFKMLNRSMSTFMNALTGPDYTMYPFATQNKTDFKNLLGVYLDAVFFPEIKKFDFLQEGWRLEHEDLNDNTSPIILKGVVYNEMKGVMADQEYLFGRNLQQNILPSHTYGICSGGNPQDIPSLTWQKLKQFHSTHYHPSNAKFFTYGNFNLTEHLNFIDEHVMQRFAQIEPTPEVPLEQRWDAMRTQKINCPPDEMAANEAKQTTCAVGYLISDTTDSYETFTLSILCNLLCSGPTSPFYKKLINSGLGSSFSPGSGFHTHQKQTYFSVGLQGLSENDTDKVAELIQTTVDDVIRDGFPEENIDGVLHQIELGLKHQSSQFGLHLSFNLMPLYQHGASLEEFVNINRNIERFQQELKDNPALLQEKCKQYFRNNRHQLFLVMSPDQEYIRKQDEDEKKLLATKIKELDHKISGIYEQGLSLQKEQNKKENISCLPTVHVSDIPRNSPKIETMKLSLFGDNINLATFEEPTNGIAYFTMNQTINDVPEELLPYLPLYCHVLTQMGTGDTDFERFSQLEDLYTGGLELSANVVSSPMNSSAMESSIVFSSHCLEKNMKHMFDLWHELLAIPNLGDKDRFRTLLRQHAQNLSNSVSYSGHMYAMKSAAGPLTSTASLSECWEGLTQIKMLSSLAELDDVDEILCKMKSISQHLTKQASQQPDSIRCAMHVTSSGLNQARNDLSKFLNDSFLQGKRGSFSSSRDFNGFLNTATDDTFQSKASSKKLHELPLPVNYVALASNTPAVYCHPDCATLEVLARLLSAKFLLPEIREKGGAYGGGALHRGDGIFQFYSYRDPLSFETLEVFRRALDWASSGKFTEQDMDEAKLSVFQKVDSPISPCNRGKSYFFKGINDKMKEVHREQLLDVSKENITDAVDRYLVGAESSIAILGRNADNVASGQKWEVVYGK